MKWPCVSSLWPFLVCTDYNPVCDVQVIRWDTLEPTFLNVTNTLLQSMRSPPPCLVSVLDSIEVQDETTPEVIDAGRAVSP